MYFIIMGGESFLANKIGRSDSVALKSLNYIDKLLESWAKFLKIVILITVVGG